MKCKVLGLQNIDYVNKTGKHVEGTSLHVTHEDSRVTGLMCESLYVSSALSGLEDVLKTIKNGDTINVEYNRYGSVSVIELVK